LAYFAREHIGDRRRAGDAAALGVVDAELAQELDPPVVLGTLGHRLLAEAAGEAHDGLNDLLAGLVDHEVADELDVAAGADVE
jgi:hypothetical protein